MHPLTLSSLSILAAAASASALPQLQQPLAALPSISIPHLGFGTWNLDKANVSDIVSAAIQTGFRHIDGAAAYGNEVAVGRGIKDGIEKAGIGRGDVWVTSKLPNGAHAPLDVPKAFEKTITELGLDYIDLYLMHWPFASVDGEVEENYLNTWRAMEALLATGRIRNLGVANFAPAQLSTLLSNTTVKPYAHQMELHPYLQQASWILYHALLGIHVTAYSPLANSNPTIGGPRDGDGDDDDVPPPLLKNEVLVGIAERRGCSVAQVALKWGLSRGTSVIPKTNHQERMVENLEAPGCELAYGDYKEMEEVGRKFLRRYVNPKVEKEVGLFEGLDGV